MEFAKEITRQLPSTEELIRMLRLQARQPHHDVAPSIALFGAGLLVGAGLALLFAPTSGRALRDEIGERAADLRERVAGAIDEASQQMNAARRTDSYSR
ncbi:MAG: YtxH domain-containing protein [Candidatus Binatia bacterium]